VFTSSRTEAELCWTTYWSPAAGRNGRLTLEVVNLKKKNSGSGE
jgi:hypothetical protein